MSVDYMHMFGVGCKLNRSELRAEPCGTLQSISIMSVCSLLYTTVCVRPLRYDWNQLKAVSVMLNQRDRTSSNMSWSTVSKAALKSSNTSRDMWLLLLWLLVTVSQFRCEQIVWQSLLNEIYGRQTVVLETKSDQTRGLWNAGPRHARSFWLELGLVLLHDIWPILQ